VDAVDRQGMTALHHAVTRGAADFVKALVKRQANVNAASSDGSTPLHIAALRNDLDCARALLDVHARTDLTDNAQRVPADIADDCGNHTLWRLLTPISIGALVRGRVGGTDGRSAVHPTLGVFFQFGDHTVGLAKYERIDPELVSRDPAVRKAQAMDVFKEGQRFDVYVVSDKKRLPSGRDGWDLVVRKSDQQSMRVN